MRSPDLLQKEFLAFCLRKNLSIHTLRAYQQDLNDFQDWSRRTAQTSPLSKGAIEQWLSDMSGRGLAPTTVKRRLACLRVLCRWLVDEERLEINPFDRFRAPIKTPKRLPRNLTPTELRTLIGSPVLVGPRQQSGSRQTMPPHRHARPSSDQE